MASQNLINIGSGNGLLADGGKPLPKTVLTQLIGLMMPCGMISQNFVNNGLGNGLVLETVLTQLVDC